MLADDEAAHLYIADAGNQRVDPLLFVMQTG